jgi:Tfp pilus assembly PilM family ATPase
MNTAATFKQVDVERAIRAASKAGLPVDAVEITREGTIRVLTSVKQELAKGPEPEL